jgi:hypothetical protein
MTAEVIIPEIKLPISVEARVERVSKAAAFAKTLPVNITTDDEDEKVRLTVQKLKALEKSLNDERTPYTKKMDEIKSKFIEQEKAVANTIAALQKTRDNYVSFKTEKIKQERIKQEFERFKNEEIILIEMEAAITLNKFVSDVIERKKTAVLNALKTVNESNKDEKFEALKAFPTQLDPVFLGNCSFDFKPKYNNDNDVAELYNQVFIQKELSLLDMYHREIETFKHECIMQFETITKLSEADKQAVIDSKVDEVKVESSTAQEVAKVEASQMAEVAKAENSMMAIAESIDNTLPSHSSGFEIEVLNNAGWTAIGAFWITVFGPKFEGNFETKTFKSMKGDLEGLAKKEGTKVVSDNLIYKEKVKARS